MNVIQIISGILLVLACAFIIFIVMIQDSKDQGMSSAISGASNDSFFGRNSSRTHEAKLNRLAKISAVVFFIATLVVNILAVYVD